MSTAVGRGVRYWRERNALSQAQLAQQANLTEATVTLVETGKVAPRPSTVKKLADALGVEPVTLTSSSFEEVETPRPKAAAPPVPEGEIDALVGRWTRRARRRGSETFRSILREILEDAEEMGLTGLPLDRVAEVADAFCAEVRSELVKPYPFGGEHRADLRDRESTRSETAEIAEKNKRA